MADSPVLYVYYRPDNDDAYPGVPNRHITEADWARFSPSQRRIVQEATTQDGYGRRKVWVHIDLVDETEQERAEREAREQAAREAYERGNSLVRYREIENVLATVDAVAGVPARMDAVEQIVSEFVSPADLPAIPGLYFHLDAQAITATDGSEVAAWTDAVSDVAATQADEAKQPTYVTNGINGKPGVRFRTADNTALVTDTLAPTGLTATVFVVMHAVVGGSSRYVFGSDKFGANTRNLYIASANGLGLQGSPTLTGFADMNKPRIAAGVFGGDASAVRLNGIQVTTGPTGDATAAPTVFTIGHRASQAEGAGFEGVIGEILYYERALTTDECAAVERYLAAKWGFTITPQRTWYVDSVFGAVGATGRTEATALSTISEAIASIKTAGAQDATVVIHAPETHPIREASFVNIDTGGTVRLTSRTPGEKWHLRGSVAVTGGWTHAGGGVYSRTIELGRTTEPFCWVPTLLDHFGQPTRVFTQNTATPTTPGPNEYGYSDGTYYLHLAGDADPNEHTVEIAQVGGLLQVEKNTTLTLRDGDIRGAQVATVTVGTSAGAEAGAGTVLATDCDASYAGTGAWRTAQYATYMKCERCTGMYSANDGFNHHGLADGSNRPIMELIECVGAWNEDEGVSPHENTRLILRGGTYHHNGSSGLTAVDTAEVQLFGTEFHRNLRLNPSLSGAETGGVSMLHQSRLISTDLYSHDHPGPGVVIDTASGATWTDNGGTRSGTAHGNGAEDQV